MHVAVCIVGFRNSEDILNCLNALEASDYADFEVVICENGGSEAYGALKAVLPATLAAGQNVHAVAATSNLGYGGGVNVCMAETSAADAWWILNPDTRPSPAALRALVQRFSEGDCDIVGGTIHFRDGIVESHGGRWHSWLSRAESIGYGAPLERAIDPTALERALVYFSGASMLVSRRMLLTAGPMREDYFLYCEEVEWCLRGGAHGMRLGFAPAARVLHLQGTTTGSVEDLRKRPRLPVYLDERNKILVARDHFPRKLPVVVVATACLMLVRFGRKRAWRQLMYGFDGWWAGLANKRGRPTWH